MPGQGGSPAGGSEGEHGDMDVAACCRCRIATRFSSGRDAAPPVPPRSSPWGRNRHYRLYEEPLISRNHVDQPAGFLILVFFLFVCVDYPGLL